ncbi:hypothetical protein [Phocaeicola sartorii]|nr:hypothetical protein [Phocaeicola sartorii]
MEITLPNDMRHRPSRNAITFLKLFARNYKELEFGDGEFAKMILK